MGIYKHQLGTGTNMIRFDYSIKGGRIHMRPRSIGYFTCGAFMRDVLPTNLLNEPNIDSENCLIWIDDTAWELDRKIVNWWLNKIKEFDIDAEYFGKEDAKHYIRYNIRNSFSRSFRLLRFTMLRYLWSTPYRVLVEHMYKEKDSSDVDKHGFWRVFMKYHAQLSTFYHYSDTFGLTHPSTWSDIKSDKAMIDLFITPQKGDYGINSMFQGEKYSSPRTSTSNILLKYYKFNEEK